MNLYELSRSHNFVMLAILDISCRMTTWMIVKKKTFLLIRALGGIGNNGRSRLDLVSLHYCLHLYPILAPHKEHKKKEHKNQYTSLTPY